MGAARNFRKDKYHYRKAKAGEITCNDCAEKVVKEAYLIGGESNGDTLQCIFMGFGNSRKYFLNPKFTCDNATV